MIAAVNHTAIPFFDRVPIRARAAVRRACDRAESRDTTDHQYLALSHDLQPLGIEPPTLDEFRVWLEEVRLGRFTRANYEDGTFYRPPAETVEKPYIADGVPMDCLVRDATGAPIRPVSTVAICPETRQLLAAGLRALADDIERNISTPAPQETDKYD